MYIFELDTDKYFYSVALHKQYRFHKGTDSLRHQSSVNLAAKISLHCTCAEKRINKLRNLGVFFNIYICAVLNYSTVFSFKLNAFPKAYYYLSF